MDFVYVNILNEGDIPYIRKRGPVFGYKLGVGAYSIMTRDKRLKMEVTTPDKAESARKCYIASKKPVIIKEEVEEEVIIEKSVEEEIIEPEISSDVISEISAIFDNVVENDENDDEIDKILESAPETKSSIVVSFKDDLDVDDGIEPQPEAKAEDRIYSNAELKSMTKAQLRQILRDRGYISGVYAPKYQDNLDKLRSKVKKTQPSVED